VNPTIPVPRFGHGSRVPGWDEAADLSKPPAVVPDPATTPVPEELRREIEAAMARYPDRRSAVIPALHAAQELHGWCSPEAIEQVAAVMQLTPAYLTSVATFYDMLETHPKPRHDVYVCTNISCSLRGADEFFDAMNEAAADDGDVNVRSFECLGACDIAPMASVNGEYVGPLEPADAEQIVDDLRSGRPVLEAKQLRFRPSADPGVSEGADEFGPPPADAPRADTAGLGPEGDTVDRPGPSAAIEVPTGEETPEPAADETPEAAPESQDAPRSPPRDAP
jgi:NADH-quinone oxidoreductase subunit E